LLQNLRQPDVARPDFLPGQDDRDVLLTRRETAAYLKMSIATLELWARNGDGAPVVHVGRGVRYRLADLRAFVEQKISPVQRQERRERRRLPSDA
jgi:hypothetical protein